LNHTFSIASPSSFLYPPATAGGSDRSFFRGAV
jgi:hypothetical protein